MRLRSRFGTFAWLIAAGLVLWEIGGLIRGAQLAIEAAPATLGLAKTGYDNITATPWWVQIIGWTSALLIFLGGMSIIWLVLRAFSKWRRKRIKNP